MSLATSKQILVIGSGGREHALSWKLSQSEQVSRIFALPGSHGIGQLKKCANVKDVKADDYEGIAKWCKDHTIDLVVVGPEVPLANGLGDVLQNHGIKCFGPTKMGSQIEADKKWAKDFMLRHGIPTARYEGFTETSKAKDFIMNAPYDARVVKAAGLAAGKGVVVAATKTEACQAVDEILGKKKYGNAGETLVIEELMTGEEISVLGFVDSNTVQVMLPAQDHKRLQEKDKGPNTGGMGAYCPCPLISNDDLDFVKREILQKAVVGLRKENIAYCGVLYAGIMLTPKGPKVLEFNCRFGDPETQVILPLLQSDLYEVMNACCENRLGEVQLKWRTGVSAVGVVMASAGYPESSTKGSVIKGLPDNDATQIIFHSGIAVGPKGEYLTDGGRVLIAVVLRKDLQRAAAEATKLCQGITFSGAGAQFRTDIAEKAFKLQKLSSSTGTSSLSYKDSGVDIDAGDELVQRIKPLSRGTQRPGVVGGLGGFGGLFRLNELNYTNPVVCESTNSVGSKIKLALEQKLYEYIGYDLVAVCANDVLETGAEAIAFLDYIACGKLQVPVAAQIVKGMSEGCREVRCALLGGETAEMPSVYSVGEYDIAGYCVGIVEEGLELPKFDLYDEGDLLISLPATNIQCTGLDLILERLYENNDSDFGIKMNFGDIPKTLGKHLSQPTRIYAREVFQLIGQKAVKAVAHITTGLLPDVQRILPDEFEVSLDFGDLTIPEILAWVAAKLQLTTETMLQNLNCGIGMVLVVAKNNTTWKSVLHGAKVLGVLKRKGEVHYQKTQIEVRNFEDKVLKSAKKFGYMGKTSLKDASVNSRRCELQNQLRSTLVQRPETFTTKMGHCLTRVPKKFKDPVLVLGTDGVGTKIKIAQLTGKNSTVGIDLVAMCVNDILCNGAEPFTFSSYYACHELKAKKFLSIASGVVEGVRQSGSSLVETHVAEVPLLYEPKIYDLAGFALGIAENARILPRSESIKAGDVLIGLPSSGVHSNGFSLVHAVMNLVAVTFEERAPFSRRSFGDEFLTPTKIYIKTLLPLIERGFVKAFAHITGGGLTENIPRVLGEDLVGRLDAEQFVIPPVFAWLADQGNIVPSEMLRTYNCGLGMVLVVDPENELQVLHSLQYSERATKVGTVLKRQAAVEPQVVVNNFEAVLKRTQKVLRTPRKRVAVLISGSGTNLQALIDASLDTAQFLHSDIVLVISNKANVGGVERAKRANIPTLVISHKDFKTREEFDHEISRNLLQECVDFVCLAGFMRVLTEKFVRTWKGRLVNIHPSLLPRHPGLHVQKKALEAGDKESGCTVHFVDEGIDTGAIIVQARVPIVPGDTEESLTQRIQRAEHFAYPKALRLLATGAVKLGNDGQAVFT